MTVTSTDVRSVAKLLTTVPVVRYEPLVRFVETFLT